jgi:hypothetical protein
LLNFDPPITDCGGQTADKPCVFRDGILEKARERNRVGNSVRAPREPISRGTRFA